MHTLILCHTLGPVITNQHTNAFADPGIFVRGVQVNQTKKSSDNVIFFQSTAYFAEVNWLISKKTIIFQGSRGGPTFSRGGGGGLTFARGAGSNCLFPIETHITCDFSGGGGEVWWSGQC